MTTVDFYVWAIEHALALRVNGEGGIQLRARQIITALRHGSPEEQRQLCTEVERSFLHITGVDGLDSELLHVAWGALALHTGYRAGFVYLDSHLRMMAGYAGQRRFDAEVAQKNVGAADARRYKTASQHNELRMGSYTEASDKMQARINEQRRLAGLPIEEL